MIYITANKSVATLINNGVAVCSFPASLNNSMISLYDAIMLVFGKYVDYVESGKVDSKGNEIAYCVAVFPTVLAYCKTKGNYSQVVTKCKKIDGQWQAHSASIRSSYYDTLDQAIEEGYSIADSRIAKL